MPLKYGGIKGATQIYTLPHCLWSTHKFTSRYTEGSSFLPLQLLTIHIIIMYSYNKNRNTNYRISSLWLWIIFISFQDWPIFSLDSILCVCVCVCFSFPLFLLANLWGFIRGLDKDCHRLEGAHTRKSPMLHCGPASYAERTLSLVHVCRHTHRHNSRQRRLSTHRQFAGKRQ